MKRFLLKGAGFIGIVMAVFVLAFLLPPTPRSMKSMFFGELHKNALLKDTPSPRIILVGGSNVNFGMNSQLIKDALNLNPINTAVHAGFGMKYMFDNTLPYIKEGDIIVVIQEYDQFWGNTAYGSKSLLKVIADVHRGKNIGLLGWQQIRNIAPYIGQYAMQKYSIVEYVTYGIRPMYRENSFNEYGDTYIHWTASSPGSGPVHEPRRTYNPKIMDMLKMFEERMRQKGATVFISYPGLQDISFNRIENEIANIEQEYVNYGFAILGTPQRYIMDNSLIFDTPYHLNKKGADRRTQLLIEDLENALRTNTANNKQRE